MKKTKLLTYILMLVVFVIFVLVIFNLLFPRLFESRKQTRLGEFVPMPEKVEGTEDIYKVDINFRTLPNEHGDPTYVSAMSFRLSYPIDDNFDVEIVDIEGNSVNRIQPNEEFAKSDEWRFPVNTVTRTDEGVFVDFAALNITTTGYLTFEPVNLATIYFRSENELKDDAFILSFDDDDTYILTKSKPTRNVKGESSLYFSLEE